MTHSPYFITGDDRTGRVICTCDHARNTVPDGLPSGLGLPAKDIDRHIAYDIGAEGVTQALADALDGPAIASNFSRLVIDPNRGEDDPTLIMRLYDGTIIPANRAVNSAERDQRLTAYHRPYHAALAGLIANRTAPVIVSIHSFTPQLQGRPPRPWHIGVLYADDARIARPLLSRLSAEPDLCVGDNEPYTGSLQGDAMDRHGLQPGHAHVLIELRNDLISTTQDQMAWGQRLAPLLTASIADAGV